MSDALPPLRLTPALQHYAWGDPSFIPHLLGRPETGEPWAEAWYGAHPRAPALARLGDESITLDRLLSRHPEQLLGADVADRFGGLPYLLKVLAAARPLSVQVHPDAAQAEAGFAREEAAGIPLDAPERCYRDPRPKPELLLALTEFDMLCGFRSGADIDGLLATLPEIAALLPGTSGADPLALAAAWFRLPAERAVGALAAVLDRITDADPVEQLLLRLHGSQGGAAPDRGLLFALLLQPLRLAPGEALFLSAGVPHAYLAGAGVELMGNSDNVLRGGLTRKHVDVDELLGVLRADASPAAPLAPVTCGKGETRWPTPAREFELRRLDGPALTGVPRRARGPEMVLTGPGAQLQVLVGDAALELEPGAACLVPHGLVYSLRGQGSGFLVRVP